MPGLMIEPNFPEGVKAITLQDNPSELKKVEYMSLRLKCDLSVGSEFSSTLLNAMIASGNKELFRSDMKIIMEYKWDQLRKYVFYQNYTLMLYVAYFTFVKIRYIEDHLFLLTFTIIVTIPELIQNYKSIKKATDSEYEGQFDFEDIQNFVELVGYVSQAIVQYMKLRQEG